MAMRPSPLRAAAATVHNLHAAAHHLHRVFYLHPHQGIQCSALARHRRGRCATVCTCGSSRRGGSMCA
jgi:hypothetical protein